MSRNAAKPPKEVWICFEASDLFSRPLYVHWFNTLENANAYRLSATSPLKLTRPVKYIMADASEWV